MVKLKVNSNLKRFYYSVRGKLNSPPAFRKPKQNKSKRKPVLRVNQSRLGLSGSFRKKAVPESFSFKTAEKWVFKDKNFEKVINRMSPMISDSKHLVLRDSKGEPRFVLGYRVDKEENFLINAIQRERTQYESKGKEGVFWNAGKETIESKRFQKKLGMHPSEFLLSEFLYRNSGLIRKKIFEGKPGLFLSLPENFVLPAEMGGGRLLKSELNYKGLIERFFVLKPVYSQRGFDFYELNWKKKRVQNLFGIKLSEK